MKKPIDQKTEVLYSLLQSEQRTLDIVKLGVCNPTSVITRLRSVGVDIVCESMPTKNKFGRKVNFGVFRLVGKKNATKIYNQLTSTK